MVRYEGKGREKFFAAGDSLAQLKKAVLSDFQPKSSVKPIADTEQNAECKFMIAHGMLENWIRVDSTAIRKVRYHPVSRRLEVVFLDSDVYQYVRFPRVKFHALLQAESKGRFVNEEIRAKHRCAKISD
jgi:hypothetical protein